MPRSRFVQRAECGCASALSKPWVESSWQDADVPLSAVPRLAAPSLLQTLVPKPESEQHTGMLGPIIRAAVGQVVTVVLKNNLSFPCNLEPSGVQPEKPGADGAAALSPEAAPGATVTYRWLVPDSMGPGPMEPSAKLWLYRWVAVGGCGCRRGTAGIRQLDGNGVQRHTLQACRLVGKQAGSRHPAQLSAAAHAVQASVLCLGGHASDQQLLLDWLLTSASCRACCRSRVQVHSRFDG